MKISAIVPVYNTEKYVRRCINSIISQTYTNWELILIDDGSTDGSPSILQEYEIKDSRIKVIHQNNSGPGIARNNGIANATGDYIVFIDSDDRIYPNYFEKLSKETAEVVFIDINQVDENLKFLRKEYMSAYENLSKEDFLRNQMTGKILWGGVRKAVKADLLVKNNIFFTNHKVGEEAIYSFWLMHHAKSFSFLKGAVYEYINRDGSQSDTLEDDPWGNVAITLKKILLQSDLYNQYANTMNAFILTAAIVSLNKIANNYLYHEYCIKAKQRISIFSTEIDKAYSIDFSHMQMKARLLWPFFKVEWITPIYCMSRINKLFR